MTRVAWSEVAGQPPTTDLPQRSPTDVVVLAYTSGTTSDPKGVIHDHRSLLSDLQQMDCWVPERSNLMGSPVTHATGMLGAVLGPFQRGSEIHVIDRWDPGHALEIMLANEIGGGTGASVFLATLLDHPDFTPQHASFMGKVGLGGAPVPVALGRRAEALGIKIIRAYGSTEHPSITGSMFDHPADQRHTTDGPPLPGVEVRLLDPLGSDVPTGTPGEIVSRGPELCVGYTNPVLDRAFDDDGWYHTGDIGVLDEHGCLTITDRVKDIIIRGGENLSAAEIEEIVGTMPGVAEVAVVAAPDERLGEHACAVIRMQQGADPVGLDDLRIHLESAGFARQKWPEEVRVVDDLPRTPSGKVRKVDLRSMVRGRNGPGR
jgi:acyl-CoA synthetase (AMP-forming)/AMP-acid ligase II